MTLKVGDLVVVNASFLNEPSGVVAYVYESSELGGANMISLITQNMVNLGGFFVDEQQKYLTLIRSTGFIYNFQSIWQLRLDIENDHFKPVFEAYA